MPTTLRELQLLNAIVVAGSISKAARLLGLSQPTVSQQLSRMEEKLGTPLLMRSRASEVDLTPAGHYWFRVSEDVLGRMREVAAFHESQFREDRLSLRMGVTPAMRGRFVAEVGRLALEQQRFARFDVVSAVTSTEIVQQMQMHRINCAFVTEESVRELSGNLHLQPVYRDRRVWAVPSSIPEEVVAEVLETLQPPADPAHRALTRYVEIETSASIRAISESWYRRYLPFSTPFFGCGSTAVGVEFVQAGLATCHIPLSQLPNLPESMRSAMRIYDLDEPGRVIVFAMPRHLLTLRAFAQFHEAVSAYASEGFLGEMVSGEILDLPVRRSSKVDFAAINVACEAEQSGRQLMGRKEPELPALPASLQARRGAWPRPSQFQD